MEVRRRFTSSSSSSAPSAAITRPHQSAHLSSGGRIQASDALPIPIRHTNFLFSFLFICSLFFLMRRWRDKVRESIPLHAVDLPELISIVSAVASLIYLLSFFGIPIVQSFVSPSEDEIDKLISGGRMSPTQSPSCDLAAPVLASREDEDIIAAVVSGNTPSYSLEKDIGDCRRAAVIRREAIRRISGKRLDGLPLEGFDYESIYERCCEMPVGYVQLPVGIAGPLKLDGREYYLPMATTEGCLVASTNRGCKAIFESGGATSVVLRDAMTRAPVVRFLTATRAARVKLFLEEPRNFDTISDVFNSSSRFARLQSVQCRLAGRNLYIRFSCSTGDAMGMNMISNGVKKVLEHLKENVFSDMDIMSLSGNFCSDKKSAAVNWIEGRGKSVVCEATIKKEVVEKVLKTTVSRLAEVNIIKNLAGSAIAGALGGFNAHASNIVSAIFLATGQDPAQNVESSQCITMMEAMNDGKDLHISVTMPSIEVGTVGGGTHLASQSACLDLLGVKGGNMEYPGANAKLLATIVAGSVLAGELSLMAALAADKLVQSHMKYNRSYRDITNAAST